MIRITTTTMITTNSKDQKANFPAAKQEASSTGDKEKLLMKAPNSSSTSTRQWSSAGFRNPRIVRVSRTFGGKDRHSKVCTVRGLRDRRIRLSVPTAVQLYDLQDRLGLSQPSKVIDWLIDATNTDIDKLPPLQFPQGALIGQFHHQHLLINPDLHHDPIAATTSMKSNLVHDQQDHQFVQKLFGMPSYLNYYHSSSSSDYHHHHQSSPNLSLSQLGLGQFSLPQLDLTSHGSNSSSSSSSLSSSSSSLNPQLFFCAQPNYSTTPLFGPYPQYITDHHHQQINHDHSARTSSSSSSSSSSQIMNQNSQNIQFLTSSSQQNHVLSNNYSLMSSLHNSNAEDLPHNLIKSFPAILNPRLFSQSILDQNRHGKGPT